MVASANPSREQERSIVGFCMFGAKQRECGVREVGVSMSAKK